MTHKSIDATVAVGVLSVLLCAVDTAGARVHRATSPDGRITFEFELDDGGRPFYRVLHDGAIVVDRSRLGFVLQDGPPMNAGLELTNVAGVTDRIDDWEQPWGERREVRNRYHELRVGLQERSEPRRRIVVTARVFDDGVGFRFTWPAQQALQDFVIVDEQTEFVLAGDPVAWWIPAYAGNRYEYLYERSRLSALAADPVVRAVHTPLTLETEDGLYVSIHEAALTDYASMTLEPGPGSVLACDLVPWSDGSKVKASTPFATPWRTIQIARRPGVLIESSLILNLNEPSRIEDTSWITPCKYAGIWWSLHIGKETWHSGPKHGATTENTKRYIDFAAANGLDAVLVEGWNTGWNEGWLTDMVFDYTTPTPDYDIEELAAYADERGVYLIGHLETGGDVYGFERRMEAAFAQCERLGIRAVKTGYVSQGQGIRRYDASGNVVAKEWQHGQYMVRHYRKVVELAAKHHVMVNVHEPIKDTGIRRTWPNMISREGARGQEYNAWSEGNPPEHTTILPFTRLLGGPMDFTPGIVDVFFNEYRPDNRVHTTVAKQLALYVVIYSPLQMVTDLPENYAGNPAFGFIKTVPADWEETRVLNAAIGDYVTIARRERGGEEWCVGSITDESARTLRVALDFLEPGVDYVASIYADGRGADYLNNPAAVSITRQRVHAETTLDIHLAPGGGQAIRFRPLKP